jgi:predicted Zn-ribbon and HTH transcriptional regulator
MNHCVRCEYDWESRVEGRPKNCPNCKSPRWDQVRVSLADAQKANAAVFRAVKSGILVRPAVCEKCGLSENIQAHHEDYSKPLDIEWLCLRCHKGRHSNGNTLVDTTTSLRPQFNLRFRSAEQFTQIQDIAAARGLAVNEWLLRQAEASEDVAIGLAAIAGLNLAKGGTNGKEKFAEVAAEKAGEIGRENG